MHRGGVRRGGGRERRGGGRGGRRGHPSGLSGKEIGLWYAARGREKKRKKELEERDVVTMSSHKEEKINNLLESLQKDNQSSSQSSSSMDQSYYGATGYDPPTAPVTCMKFKQEPPTEDMQSDASTACPVMKFKQEPQIDNIQRGASASSSGKWFEDVDQDYLPLDTELMEPEQGDIVMFDELGTGAGSSINEQTSVYGSPFENLQQDSPLDKRLKDELDEKKTSNKQYIKMQEFRKKLPSYEMREELLSLINKNQVIVISGETGCGKTTQVAQFILDDEINKGRGSLCRIACTQPRRISAISVAERVASERGEPCGGHSVGYQIRLDCKLPRTKGSIIYCTTGVLLRWLRFDTMLCNISHVIIDEIHERDLMSDFLLIIAKDLLPLRPDLKLILMSATLNAEKFSSYFGGCPMAHIPGFTFPVKEFYIEEIIEMTSYRKVKSTSSHRWEPQWKIDKRERRKAFVKKVRMKKMAWDNPNFEEEQEREEIEKRNYLIDISRRYSPSTVECLENMCFDKIDKDLVAKLIIHICSRMLDGAILVFLPGWDDISIVHDKLKAAKVFSSDKYIIIPLHSLMPTASQREVFERPPPGIRKIVLATNIAETSITIDDVVYVIDCGKAKEKSYDVSRKISCLTQVWISKASSKQRRGRAGRVQPGYCFHLFTELQAQNLIDYQLPEMLRTPLEEIALQIKVLKLGMVAEFLSKALQPPSPQAVQNALDTLRQLNALDLNENLTPLGYHLAALPVDPRIGKIILFGAIFSCLDPVLTIAATLGFKDPFVYPLDRKDQADKIRRKLAGDTKSDHLAILFAYKGWEEAKRHDNENSYCWDHFLSKQTLKMLCDMKSQFAHLLSNIGFLDNNNPRDPAANHNSDNLKLIKAVLCAGLYPNVVKIVHGNNLKRPPQMCTKEDGRVSIHPKSVNVETKVYENNWLIYHQKVKSTKIFIHDCTMIPPFPLLFFGGDISVLVEEGSEVVAVDDFIRFKSPKKIATLVKELRAQLDKLLERKIAQPYLRLVVDSSQDQNATALLHAIIDLITTEDSKNWKRLRAIEAQKTEKNN